MITSLGSFKVVEPHFFDLLGEANQDRLLKRALHDVSSVNWLLWIRYHGNLMKQIVACDHIIITQKTAPRR